MDHLIEGLGAMNIYVSGKWEVYVENYKNIIEYSGSVIKLQGKGSKVKIIGNNLKIEYYTKENMKIKGSINEVKFF